MTEAQTHTATWKEEAQCLSNLLSHNDAVIQTTLGVLKTFEEHLGTLAKLQSPTLKQKHWKAVFEGQMINFAFTVKTCQMFLSRSNMIEMIWQVWAHPSCQGRKWLLLNCCANNLNLNGNFSTR